MIVQRYVSRAVVKMDGRNNHMRDTGVVGEQRKQRVVVAVGVVVSLVVNDKPWACRYGKQFRSGRSHYAQ